MSRTTRLAAERDYELPELHGRETPTRIFNSTYYDTADRRLARAGFMLRRRVENGKSLWQLATIGNGVDVQQEGGPAEPPAELQELVTALRGGFDLTQVARLRTKRNGVRVRAGRRTLAEVTMDSVSLLDGQRVVGGFAEVEVERLAADRKELKGIVRALRKTGAHKANGQATLESALGVRPVTAEPAPSEDLDRLRSFFRAQHTAILANDPGTRIAADAEHLHQLRVATRRLRSVLRSAAPLLDAAWADRLREDLEWLGGLLGAPRDLDVLLANLRSEAARLEPAERKAIRSVLARLERERGQAQAALLEALKTERYLGLLATLEQAATSPSVDSGSSESLAKLAAAEFSKLVKAMRRLDEAPSDEAMHRARIKGKRARYAAELFADESKQAARLVRSAKALQDVTGDYRDSVVAETRLRELASRLRSQEGALAVGRLIERQRTRRRAAADALPGVWADVKSRGRQAWA